MQPQFLFNAAIILTVAFLYGLLHSILAAERTKQWLDPVLGRGYRFFFNLVAGLTLMPLLALVPLLPDFTMYVVPTPYTWGMMGMQGLAIVLAGQTLLQTDALHFLGLKQLLYPRHLVSETLTLSGFYRVVRHPLYFFSLIVLWFSPLMTWNQFILYVGFSAYLWIGAIFEERKLRRLFGDSYGRYQQTVPMMLPWRFNLWHRWLVRR